ncbi:MAG: alcohol dehydrogenase catalytic domain-containing protein [Acidimicrobiales bacterium]
MRAFVVTEPGSTALGEWAEPTVSTGEVVVRPLLVGMCATDLELIDGTIDPAYVRYPLVLGHEWVGSLEGDSEVGPAGARVVVEGIVPCAQCEECRRGDTNLCTTYDEIGFTRAGALGERVSVPSLLVHRLAEGVDLNDAVLVEPMAVVWRALTRVPLRSGLRVAIVGDGTIALLCAHLVGQFAPSRVTVIGRRAEQRELALRAGAQEFLYESPAEKFDLVVEAAGNAAAVTSALGLCARGGMVILLGLPPHGTKVEIAPDDLVNDDVIIQASFSYTRKAFAEVVERLNAKEVRPSFLVTHRFSIDDVDSAVATLRGPARDLEAPRATGASALTAASQPRGKVVVEVAEG